MGHRLKQYVDYRDEAAFWRAVDRFVSAGNRQMLRAQFPTGAKPGHTLECYIETDHVAGVDKFLRYVAPSHSATKIEVSSEPPFTMDDALAGDQEYPIEQLMAPPATKPLDLRAILEAQALLEQQGVKGPFHIEVTRNTFVERVQDVLDLSHKEAEALGDKLVDGQGNVRVYL